MKWFVCEDCFTSHKESDCDVYDDELVCPKCGGKVYEADDPGIDIDLSELRCDDR